MDYAKKKHSTTKGYIAKFVLVGLMMPLVSFCSRAYALNWSIPQVVMNGYMGSDIAVDKNNNWHIVSDAYSYDGDGTTYYIKYISNTGGPYVVAEASESLTFPSIDVDSNGGLHVAYNHYGSTQVMYTTSEYKTYVLSVGVKISGEIIGQDIQAERVRNAFAVLPAVTHTELLTLSCGNSNNTNLLESAISNAANELSNGGTFIMYIGAHGFFDGGFDEPNIWAQYDVYHPELRLWTKEDEHIYLSQVNSSDNVSDDVFSSFFTDAPWPNIDKLFIIDTCYSGGFWGDITGLDSGDLGRLTRAALIPAAPEANFAGTYYDSNYDLYLGKLGGALVDTLNSLSYQYSTVTFYDLISVLQHWGDSYRGVVGPILGFNDNWDIPIETDFNVQPKTTTDFHFMLQARISNIKGDLNDDGIVNIIDFGIFANHWLRDDCEWPEHCHGTDIAPEIPDGVVDMLDLAVIANHWLEGTTP